MIYKIVIYKTFNYQFSNIENLAIEFKNSLMIEPYNLETKL